MGFSESLIGWYKSYLEERYFVVNVAGSTSDKASLNCEVPQGSILGPLIFLMYINDMAQAVKCDSYLYTDDSCLVYTGRDMNAIEDTLHFGEDILLSDLIKAFHRTGALYFKNNLPCRSTADLRNIETFI